MRFSGRIRAGILGGLLLAAAACKQTPNAGGPADAGGEPGGARSAWPFWPASVRIHPSSRLGFDTEYNDTTIELRLQFADAWGHQVKAVGVARVDLFAGQDKEATRRTPLRTWFADLADLDYNAQRFDEVTWTYLLNLRLQGLAVPAENTVAIRFESANGQVMNDRATLRLPAKAE